jgi:hypothetical protein
MWRASQLEGVDIYNNNNEKIGDVSDVLVDQSGKVEAVVIGVGGFLGIGERNVAVPFNALKFEMTEPSASASNNAAARRPRAEALAPGRAPRRRPLAARPAPRPRAVPLAPTNRRRRARSQAATTMPVATMPAAPTAMLRPVRFWPMPPRTNFATRRSSSTAISKSTSRTKRGAPFRGPFSLPEGLPLLDDAQWAYASMGLLRHLAASGFRV